MVQSKVGRFTEGLYDPYDLTGDGKIKTDDVNALLSLINALNTTPRPHPTSAVKIVKDSRSDDYSDWPVISFVICLETC